MATPQQRAGTFAKFPFDVERDDRSSGGKVIPPVVVGDGTRFSSSRQIKGYLLCESCVALFRSVGEDWVMDNCYLGLGTSRCALLSSCPQRSCCRRTKAFSIGFQIYARLKQLNYNFGIAMCWRAAAHTWRSGQRTVNIDPGPYVEPLRTYLFRSPFPHERINMFRRVSMLEEYAAAP